MRAGTSVSLPMVSLVTHPAMNLAAYAVVGFDLG